MFLISLIMTIYSNFTLLKKNKIKGDIKMYAAIDKLKLYRLAEQLFPQLFKLSLLLSQFIIILTK